MSETTELCDLAWKYGTDKCPKIKHNYTPIYYDLLKDKRDSFKKILEIGIGDGERMSHEKIPPHYQKGASLRMWRDFFPKAHIYGVDIIPNCLFQDERITTFLADATNDFELSNIIKDIGSDIDMVIDDGGHSLVSQLQTFGILMPLLKKDVIYIIEDARFPDSIKEKLSDYDCRVLRLSRRRQDTLIIIKNK
jgi:hypothetical protein